MNWKLILLRWEKEREENNKEEESEDKHNMQKNKTMTNIQVAKRSSVQH